MRNSVKEFILYSSYKKFYGEVSDKFLNEKLCPVIVKLGDDPVPNIKFNVSKTIEIIYKKVNNSNKIRF